MAHKPFPGHGPGAGTQRAARRRARPAAFPPPDHDLGKVYAPSRRRSGRPGAGPRPGDDDSGLYRRRIRSLMAAAPDRAELGLADTSLFVAIEPDRPLLGAPPRLLAVSVITIAELRLGVLAAGDGPTRARRLETLTRANALDPIPVVSQDSDYDDVPGLQVVRI